MELKEFIHKSLKGENLPKFTIGTVSESLSKKIKDRTGINVLGYKICLISSDIRHVINQHGNEKFEKNRGQIAINESDLLLIPDIIKHSDIIYKSDKLTTYEKNKAIKFVKQYKDEYWVIDQVIESDKSISLKTMYIKQNLLT